MYFKKINYSRISYLDLINAKKNCEFLMKHFNFDNDVFVAIAKFHIDLCRELERRCAYG